MSTLTSSQLHVKRSSTRLHAPPGGASSISFGPGGLGTVDAAVEDDGEKAPDPAALPPRTGAYTGNNNNISSGYDYAPQKGGTPSGYGGGNAAMASGYSTSNNNWSDPYGQPPSTSSMGGGGMMPPQQQQQQFYGAGPSRQLSSSGSMGSSRSWGSQPPLTSSKRDQNWERKRRQWLARKSGSNPMGFSGGRLQSAGPPGSSYGSGGSLGMNPWDDQHGTANAPPSPLSKFVHQQSQKQQQQGGFSGGYVDYERIGTATSALPQPPATPSYPRGDSYSSGGGYAPPSRSGLHSQPPQVSSSGAMGMSHFPQAASEYGYYGTPASRDGPAVAGVATTGGGGYGVPGSSGNMSNRNVSSARQPPGGHSNWSPFS